MLSKIKSRCIVNERGCWIWRGAVGGSKSPRPQIRINWKCWYVTNVVWKEVKGEITPGLRVCHACDERLCVNPEHLYLASHKENMRDASRRGRFKDRAAISDDLVEVIKRLYSRGDKLTDIAGATGVSYGMVTNIVYGFRRGA